MLINDIQISIITLTKNDYLKFQRTVKSIQKQDLNFCIEWIIIDGSERNNFLTNKNLIKNKFSNDNTYFIKYINMNELKIDGIYPSMNYGKKICQGRFLIFLNSGDTFYNKNSLKILYQNSLNKDIHSSLIFGQAKVIADKKISWYFPGNKLNNIRKWLKFFEPNHQSMLVSKTLANKFDFSTLHNMIGDGYWKRKILDTAEEVIFIKKPVIKFFLDGISSSKPSRKLLKELILNKNISFFRKFVFFIKFLFPTKIFFLYYSLQKLKSNLFDIIF